MKNFKNGFSLAELLLALAIISIIAVMGYSVTKKNTEKAYNLYIYTGYNAIQNAMADASSKGYELDYDNFRTNSPYIRHIIKLLSATVDEEKTTASRIFITTPNNIKYELENFQKVMLYIKMTVPSNAFKITINNAPVVKKTKTFTFTYMGPKNCNALRNFDMCDVLIPVKGIEYNEGFEYKTNYINLNSRMDLLPFYIDDGIPSIINEYNEVNNSFTTNIDSDDKREYMSYSDAFLKKNALKRNNSSTTSNMQLKKTDETIIYITHPFPYTKDETKTPSNGIIRVANPRKIF